MPFVFPFVSNVTQQHLQHHETCTNQQRGARYAKNAFSFPRPFLPCAETLWTRPFYRRRWMSWCYSTFCRWTDTQRSNPTPICCPYPCRLCSNTPGTLYNTRAMEIRQKKKKKKSVRKKKTRQKINVLSSATDVDWSAAIVTPFTSCNLVVATVDAPSHIIIIQSDKTKGE